MRTIHIDTLYTTKDNIYLYVDVVLDIGQKRRIKWGDFYREVVKGIVVLDNAVLQSNGVLRKKRGKYFKRVEVDFDDALRFIKGNAEWLVG